MTTEADTQLMLNFKDGDQRAFQLLFDKYKKRVINYCYRFCGHQAVAEDLAQETFLRVYMAAKRYEPRSKFSTWLFKIAANVCLNEIRKPVYRVRLESIDQDPDEAHDPALDLAEEPNQSMPDAMLEAHQDQAVVRKAMGDMPKEQRAALLLRATEGFSYHEIGVQINRTENQVKTLIHRGRQRLISMLGDHWGKDGD
jgi:RNA polymerase sigma-70 factor, ECF subfamily